jgi:hypothetical protein
MLSNPQIFENKWEYISDTLHTMKSQHFFRFQVNWAFPVLIVAFASFFILITQKVVGEALNKYGYGMQEKEIKVDEDLPNFFKCVKLSQADEVIAEEENMQNNFGFLINDPDTIAALEDVEVPKKACQGTPWYQILSNSKYSDLFGYIGAYVGEREKLIEIDPEEEAKLTRDEEGELDKEGKAVFYEQSDLIMVLLNLAVIPDKVAKKIEFNPGW